MTFTVTFIGLLICCLSFSGNEVAALSTVGSSVSPLKGNADESDMKLLSRKTEDLCTNEKIEELAACGCYVESTSEDAPGEELEVCHKIFGENLLSLKSHCKNYVEDGEVNTEAVTEAIAELKKECMPELLNSLGSSRKLSNRQSLEKATGRWIPLLIAAAILLYPTKAY